jgi:hypothetical protein
LGVRVSDAAKTYLGFILKELLLATVGILLYGIQKNTRMTTRPERNKANDGKLYKKWATYLAERVFGEPLKHPIGGPMSPII